MQKKEVYGFRKSKISKTLCGAVLGAAFTITTAQNVLADDVTETSSSSGIEVSQTGNPATNLAEAQGQTSQSAAQSQEQAGQTSGSLSIEASTAELDQAVSDAKEAGVEVQQDETADKGTVTSSSEAEQKKAEIEADYAQQAEEIKKTTAAYQQTLAAYQEEVAKVEAENKATEEQYNKDIAAYQAEVERVNAANAAAKAAYEAALQQYETDLAAVQAANAASEADYQAKLAAYQLELARVQTANAAAKTAYEQALAETTAKNAAISAENTAIQERNAAAKTAYEAALQQYETELAAVQAANAANEADYQAKLATYQTELARVRAANAAAKTAYEQALAETTAKNAAISAENAAVQARNAAAKADYEAKLAQYQADLAEYEEKLKAYEEEQASIKQALEELEKHKKEAGNLSEPSAQSLVYDLEPNADLSLTTTGSFLKASAVDEAFSHDTANYAKKYFQLDNLNVTYLEQADDIASSMELYGVMGDKSNWTSNITSGNAPSKWASVLLEKGQSATATYTNLENTFYNGKKVSKIEFTYTVDPSSTFQNPSGKVWLGIFTDPTLGVFASAYTGGTETHTSLFIKNTFTFYDENGNPIEFDEALLSVASLNREANSIEMAKDYTGTFIKITGSSVGESNHMIYATESENFRQGVGGSLHTMYTRASEPGSGWDTADAPNSWYGAGVLKISGAANSVTVGTISSTNILGDPDASDSRYSAKVAGKKPNIWYSLNGKIRAVNVPKVTKEKPTEPTAPVDPTYETEQSLDPLPIEPTYEGEPVAPIRTPDQSEPSKPTDPTYETEQSLDPLPIEPTYEGEPVAPTRTPDQSEPSKPTDPTYETEQSLDPLPIEPIYEEEPVAPTRTPDQSEPNKPAEPDYEGIPISPITPIYKRKPDAPAVPTIHFHYAQLFIQPQVNKEIKNNDGTDIDRTLVAKQSLVRFELKTADLAAGRDTTTSFVLVDPLPSGYVLDLEATKTASAGFDTSYDAAAHTITFKATEATLALYNADLTQSVSTLFPTVIGRVQNDGATYTNNFSLTVNDAYGIRSNIVRVTTPGKPDDPDNPSNNYIRPTKVNKNEAGLVIDGKSVLAGSTNYYELTWDLDQYKGDQSSAETIQKGFFYLDDYPEEALTVRPELIQILDNEGAAVEGVSVQQYDSIEQAPETVQDILQAANISPIGAFQLFSADDPAAFYTAYVAAGKSLTIIDPMTVKESMGQTGGQFENKAYQIDFGNGYAAAAVVNNVPKIDPKKDVSLTLDPASAENADNQEIALHQIFNYRLIGGLVPANRSDDLFEYSFVDDYDQTGDAYTGQYQTFAKIDLTLKDGTVLKAGTDLTSYTESESDEANGVLIIKFKEDFLRSVSNDSAFQAETYIQMKRISVGSFENTYVNHVNGVAYASNTVKTSTPAPKPADPAKESSVSSLMDSVSDRKYVQTAHLPKTGTSSSVYMPYLGLAALVGVYGLTKIKRKED